MRRNDCFRAKTASNSLWAGVCRHIGAMSRAEFDQLKAELTGIDYTQTSICQRLKNLFSLKIENNTGFPLVSLGQGKPGEEDNGRFRTFSC